MRTLGFDIDRWAAWAPGVESQAQWAEWSAGRRTLSAEPATPDVKFLPPMLRRRTSRVTRAALWAIRACGGDQGSYPTVFSSRHGELHRSHALLQDLAVEEPLSPNAFSLSVHNTASGLYTIATGNRAPSTALAAGRDTLAAGVIQAFGQLRAGADAVVLVHADECAPSFYQRWVDYEAPVFALALVLRRPDGQGTWRLTHGAPPAGAADSGSHELAVMHMLAGERRRQSLAGERGSWLWERD